jgi:hypothetical protein
MTDRNQSPFSLPSAESAAAEPHASAEPGASPARSAPLDRAPMRANGRPRHQLRPVSEMAPDTEDNRLHIPKHMYPDQFDLQWVTDSIFGQPQPNHRSRHERRGW